jgi:hypothetical protein
MMYSTCESCIWCACLHEFKFWQAQKYFIPSTNGNKVVLCAILYREFPFFFLLTIERRTCLLYE